MLKLYHGSNVVIDKIDLCLSRRGKDFGCGFYLNPIESQAKEMAVRTTQRLQEGTPVVNAYLFDDSLLMEDSAALAVKVFEDYSVEWAEFILMNRRNMTSTPAHPYDIVIGPIADDTVGLQMRRFIQGYISIDRMIEELRFKKPAVQYFFGTEKAVSYLKKI
ncbi:DUF3990 domain-containing protein [Prevotella copri]|jgi:hypothetical protein|uniref:DUF3990 domain-containing protein n=1 Tax=Segatella copri TaxID=165179 RepID=UPI001C384EE1|nr:DUF3990 domain-containing protein [Segatella copri]MBV3413873.1 DUF3990 domain-containing protein [Segatella copri]